MKLYGIWKRYDWIKLAALGIAFWIGNQSAFAGNTYIIDPVHSAVWFRIVHLNVAPAYGAFSGISGKVYYDPAQPETASIEVIVDTRTVNTMNEKRDAHLRSPDFFNVETYPEARFKSESWKKIEDNKFRIKGKLTLLGVEKEIEFEARLIGIGKGRNNEDRIGFEAVFPIQRSVFGMNKYLPTPLSDEVVLTVGIEAEKKE